MTLPLVSIRNVDKIYPRVHKPGERLRAFASLLRGKRPTEGAQVLTDVSLEVFAGQSVGIIGENGAGKSTLLKVLTGVIEPSRGEVCCSARTAALLELGAGFQLDFSGLENVRMKASLLGMSRQEFDSKLDEILAFADIGQYIHEPVKHYSSGMVVRLGFAVVAASDPELLITDEVLAVGDESFQKKCIRWIDDFIRDGGTLLLVSHSMYLVQKLCQQAIWLKGGKVEAHGDVHRVTQDYLAWHEAKNSKEAQHRRQSDGAHGHYQVLDLMIGSSNSGSDTEELQKGDTLSAQLRLKSPDGRPPIAMIGIVRLDGTPIFGVSSEAQTDNVVTLSDPKNNIFECGIEFPDLPLMPGRYILRGHVLDPEGLRVCDTQERQFRIAGESRDLGLVRLEHRWSR